MAVLARHDYEHVYDTSFYGDDGDDEEKARDSFLMGEVMK